MAVFTSSTAPVERRPDTASLVDVKSRFVARKLYKQQTSQYKVVAILLCLSLMEFPRRKHPHLYVDTMNCYFSICLCSLCTFKTPLEFGRYSWGRRSRMCSSCLCNTCVGIYTWVRLILTGPGNAAVQLRVYTRVRTCTCMYIHIHERTRAYIVVGCLVSSRAV